MNDFFCNLLVNSPKDVFKHHIFCFDHCLDLWIFKKCANLCFILKNDYHFKSHQNMLTILGFNFLYHKLRLCFICHANKIQWAHMITLEKYCMSFLPKNFFIQMNFGTLFFVIFIINAYTCPNMWHVFLFIIFE